MPPDALQAPGEAPGKIAARGQAGYAQFWPDYLAAHADRRTRALHYLGTGGALMLLALALLTLDWRPLATAPIVGYGFAWAGHAVFERNRPQTFSRPLWSFYSDIRMLGLFLSGRIAGELRRLRIGR